MIPIHYFSGNDIVIITLNKVASRFIQKFANNGFLIESEFLINSDYEIDFKSFYINSFNEDIISIQQVSEEWNSIIKNNIKKQVVFIYRNPLNRTYSGVVQNFLDYVFEPNTFLKNSKTLGVAEDNIYLSSLLEKTNTETGEPWYHEYTSVYDLFDENEVDLIVNMLLTYFKKIEIQNISETGHTRKYLKNLYKLISKVDLNTSNINLINIDVYKELLGKFLMASFNSGSVMSNKTSNKFFVDKLKNEKDIYIKLLNILEDELYFYEKLIEHPFNLKDQ